MPNNDLKNVLFKSFELYKKHHPRSNKKLIPLHKFIATKIQAALGDGYNVNSFGHGSTKEDKFTGIIHGKRVDISILKEKKEIGAIGIKFVMSNYKQNAINYLENKVGETFNLRGENIIYSQVFIIRNPLPYYTKKKEVKKIEYVTSDSLKRYKKLSDLSSKKQYGVPNSMFLFLVNLDDNTVKEYDIEKVKNIDDEVKKYYIENSDIDVFVDNFALMIKDLELKDED